MLNFIVVEDNQEEQKEIRDIINKVAFNSDVNFNIIFFDRYNSDLKRIIEDNSEVKVYILDIELNSKISGIQIAKKIRENDLEDEIVFITNHDHMFEEVYRTIYKVYDFIEKFNNFKPRLTNTIKTLLNREDNNKVFKYKSRNLELKLYIKNILFVYRDTYDRKLIIKTTNNSYAINMTIKDIKDKLGPKFKQISRSCLVNTDLVESYNYNKGYVILSNGEKVEYLSKTYREKDEKTTSNI